MSQLTFPMLLIVGLGGFFGTIGRYLVGLGMQGVLPAQMPVATFTVNVVGCFFAGIVSSLLEKQIIENSLYVILMVGFLGGFTTFSALGLESYLLVKNSAPFIALASVLLNVVVGVLVVMLGRALV